MPGLRLMITRPQEDAAPLAARLRALGHEVLLEPLLEIGFKDNVALDLDGVAAVLATSANGVRALARMCGRRDVPLFAVGDATARAARDAGFRQVTSAGGDVHALAATVAKHLDPAQGRLLHVAGTRQAGDLQGLLSARGFDVDRAVLYDATTAERLSEQACERLCAGTIDGVLFFSPRTARTFVSLAVNTGLGGACRGVTAYCLSPAVADGATHRPDDLAWRRVCAAVRPEETSLLELLEAEQ
ncbi:MAG: uroporphyrinogen-III synthase [Rhodospirillales bacterium]|nr:uroporphyrinogen-III synthase [Rhodospirillales bacterium]